MEVDEETDAEEYPGPGTVPLHLVPLPVGRIVVLLARV